MTEYKRAMVAPQRAAGLPLGIAVALAVGPAVGLGLARFAYALLLPAMRADFGWSYAEAGAMNTANAAGYIVGALALSWAASRFGAARAFTMGVLTTGLALIASAATENFMALLALRAIAGFAGAFAFVIGASLAAQAGTGAARERQTLMIAIYVAGGGAGIVISSLVVPVLLLAGAGGWRFGWLVLGAVSLIGVALATPAARRAEAAGASAAAKAVTAPKSGALIATYLVYALFGAGYIAYMTFIVAFLRSEAASAGTIAAFWTLLGLSSVVACFFWGRVSARLPGGWPMVVILIVDAIGAVLPLLANSSGAVFGSAVLFGGSVMAMPGAVTTFVRKALPPSAWTATLGRLTVAFGLGQCAGPVLSGALADSTAGIRLGLLVSVGILVLTAFVAALQREPVTDRETLAQGLAAD